jgi:hypothetical protein
MDNRTQMGTISTTSVDPRLFGNKVKTDKKPIKKKGK